MDIENKKPNNKRKKTFKALLYSLSTIFVFLIVFLFAPFSDEIKRPLFLLMAILGILFLILGAILIFFARKEKSRIGTKRNRLKLSLMITGLSAISPFVFTILHNFFYALGMVFEKLQFIFEILHATSFIIAIVVAPIIFVIGTIVSFVYLKKYNS
jgi:hypothetical protein